MMFMRFVFIAALLIIMIEQYFKDRQRMKAGSDAPSKKKAKKKTVADMKPKPPPLVIRILTGALSNLARAYNVSFSFIT